MFELQGGNKGKRVFVPNSGPGTQWLIAGDMDAGFFGEVSSGALIGESALSKAVGLNRGIPLEENPGWLKFIYEGKIIYIAKRPLRYSTSWEDLYQAGLVYGTPGPGSAPSPSDRPAYQLRVVTKGEWFLKVRLATGGGKTPTVVGGEWDNLLLRVSENDPSGKPWAEYTNVDLHIVRAGQPGSQTLVMERDTTAKSRSYGSITDLRNVTLIDNSTTIGWRPALELIRGVQPLYPLYGLSQLVSGGDEVEQIVRINVTHLDLFPINDMEYSGDMLAKIAATVENALGLEQTDSYRYQVVGDILPVGSITYEVIEDDAL